MEKRVYALIQVGKVLGIDAMLTQVKNDEKAELHRYLRRYFLNTHGMSQADEFKACEYQQEATELGYKYIKALYEV